MSVVFVVLGLLAITGSSQVQSSMNATVYINKLDGVYTVTFGVLDKENGVAYGTFDDNVMTTGWGELNIVSGTAQYPYDDSIVMHGAGYLEGALTARLINEHYHNVFGVFFKGEHDTLLNKVAKFLQVQDQWMRSMIKTSTSSPLWRQLKNIIAQYDGLLAGYQAHPDTEKVLPALALQILNAYGDLITLASALAPETVPDWDHMTKEEILKKVLSNGHCSVLIKVLPGYENILASHTSWFHYSSMIRIYKHYHLNIKESTTGSIKMSFSSYPGLISSLDDFYIMDSGLVLLETTNIIFNTSLYEHIQPQSLLAWQRVRLANLMARNGKEWAGIFEQYNSGTYNNQYMILDLKLVELKNTLHDNALWVVEQIPTYVASGDQTAILRLGYWPSYNVPFYEKVYNMSGYPEFIKKHGTSYSYQLAPRAKIFRRDQGLVRDMDTLKHLLRYNDYKNDPYSLNNPMNSICSRGDLTPDKPIAFGCTDTKVTDLFMAKALTSYAVYGPTAQNQPPFHWSQYKFPDKHVGMPDLFNFDFTTMQPKQLQHDTTSFTER